MTYQEIKALIAELAQDSKELHALLKQQAADHSRQLKEFRTQLQEQDAQHKKQLQEHYAQHKKELQEQDAQHKKQLQEDYAQHKREIEEIRALIKAGEEASKQRQKEFEEASKQWQREFEERSKQREKEADERYRRIDRRLDRIAKQIGDYTNSEGEILEEKFFLSLESNPTLGSIQFNSIDQRVTLPNQAEFDILLTNGDSAAAIEVKQKIRRKDVLHLHEQLPKLRQLKPYDRLRIYGAVAGQKIHKDAIEEAKKKGFFILQESPSGFKILNEPRFKPTAH